MKTIFEALAWKEIRVTAHAAAQYIPLKYGEAGTGGTRATLIAGTHGDEGPWSALAIKLFCQRAATQLSGRLRVIFTANALAAEVERRNSWIDSPNAVDLDGVFPGNEGGSHTERLAAHLAPLIADSDVVIDLHGGGTWCINAFVKRFEGSEQLAADLGAPFISNAPNKRGGLTTYARSLGIKVANVEVGGRSGREMYWTERNALGLERALYNLGVLSLGEPPAPAEPAVDVGSTQAIRAKVGGIFVPTLREDAVGTIVPAGTEMGKILDLHTLEELEVFTAPFERSAMMLMRPQICTIEGSALVYVVAQPA
ncbi:succinylglutamate desuccinylase/aspartoacylase family protein [Kouleothrix sp.]|uniref:succinylglutamate desuccinylase/aspartoacylase family protein n=1 Tax=Kouleothrix sp. TaxID=2779161 RepID=UPI00391A4604